MHAFRPRTSSSPRRWLGLALCILMLASACGESGGDSVEIAQKRVTNAEKAVADAEAGLHEAGAAFCDESKDYIAAIDRYGKGFNDEAATVGDVNTLGDDLGRPRDSTVAAGQAVLDSHDTLNEANQELADAQAELREAKAAAEGKKVEGGKPDTPAPSEPAVPQASVDRVKTAEEDLAATSEGISDDTPLTEATEGFNSAAFALEVAWANLFADAGCLTDAQAAEAASAIRAYTVGLQTELKAAGHLNGEVDGVYGPETVEAVRSLQGDAELPETGLVDMATRAALDDALARKGESAATDELVTASAVQTALKLAGYWPGAVDGKWTPELEAALKEFQKDLGLEPTGAVDTATLAALKELLVTIQSEPTATPSPSS